MLAFEQLEEVVKELRELYNTIKTRRAIINQGVLLNINLKGLKKLVENLEEERSKDKKLRIKNLIQLYETGLLSFTTLREEILIDAIMKCFGYTCLELYQCKSPMYEDMRWRANIGELSTSGATPSEALTNLLSILVRRGMANLEVK